MKKKKHISLFSGIGGFDLAADWMGWENVAHCEWNPFGQEVLKHCWPYAISYHDITTTDFTVHRGQIDILTGGFPCQPYSAAGLRKGKEDERHLWPQMLRAVREIAPPWVVGENVRGLVNWNGGLVFDEVQADLEAEGYEVQPFLLPAAGVNAPHERYRIWFVAFNPKRKPNGGHHTGASSGDGLGLERGQLLQARWEQGSNHFGASGIDAANANCIHRRCESQLCCSDGTRTRYQSAGSSDETIANSSDARAESLRRERQNSVYGFETFAYPHNKRMETPRDAGICATQEHNRSSGNGSPRNVAYPASKGLQVSGQTGKRQLQKEVREGMDDRPEQPCIHAAYADGLGLRGKGNGIGKSGFLNQAGKANDWSDFPTQPPVCDGDDGFPAESLRQRIREDCMGVISEKEIDKILSKAATEWRNETIIAGGNAIVPELALQIFKAIEAYDLLTP